MENLGLPLLRGGGSLLLTRDLGLALLDPPLLTQGPALIALLAEISGPRLPLLDGRPLLTLDAATRSG